MCGDNVWHYAFIHFPNVNLLPGLLEYLIVEDIDECLTTCAVVIEDCRAVNYRLGTQECSLLGANREDAELTDSIDEMAYYELRCEGRPRPFLQLM